jgi:hypothetical protein
MAQIYGELIRAQLQSATSGTIGAAVPGLVYFNSDDKKLTLNDGTSWQKLVTEAALAGSSSLLPIVPLTKGGLGVDASGFLGLFRVELGVVTAGQINVTDIPDLTVLYSKLDLADGDIPQVKVANLTTDLAAKMTGNAAITGDTKAKITYDSKGLVTAGADLVAADLPLITPSKGGTGVANNDAATLTRSGNHALTLTTTAATGVTLPTAGTLATLAGSEQLSSKTLVEPVVDNFAAFNQESTPAAASAGTVRVYAKADNKLYKMDSTGAEAAIGSGSGSGGVNYLVDWYDSSKPVGTVSTVAANGNIVVSGSAPAVTSAWYADTTSGAAAIAASTSTLLRGSSNYLTALSGVSTSGATFVQSPAFNIDGSDLGKPVTISFDVSGVTTIDDWDVIVARYTVSGTTGTFAELISVAGNASAITGTPGAEIPTGTVQFKGFFIPSATATDVYALRLRRRAGATQIRVDSLTVGPQSLAQGAVVTGGNSFTPTLTGFGTVSTYPLPFKWYRSGTRIKVVGQFQAGTPTASTASILLPSNLTHSLPATGTGPAVIGSWVTNLASISNPKRGVILAEANTSKTLIYFGISEYATAQNSYTKQNGNEFTTASTLVNVEFELDIDQWSSGTTTLADRAVEEYASNGGAAGLGTSDLTDFKYGPSGSLIGNLTSGLIRRVRFQTALLATDNLIVEVSTDRVMWFPMTCQQVINSAALDLYTNQNGVRYGMGRLEKVNSTDVDVTFGLYSFANGATYGSAGSNWAAVGAGYWRVRKISGGAAVGFPVSARNIVGDTSGTAVPAGYVGETKVVNLGSSSFVPSTSLGDVTGLTMTLDSGVWQVKYQATVYLQNNAAATTTFINLVLTDGSNNQIANTQSNNAFENLPTAGVAPILTVERSAVWIVSGGQTLKLRAFKSSNSGSTSLLHDAANYRTTAIIATRIA